MDSFTPSQIMRLRIPNWSKYNPRSDRGNFSWFRMENRFFHNQAIFLLPLHAKIIFIFLLSEASRTAGEGLVEIAPAYAASVLGLSAEQVIASAQLLLSSELVEIPPDTQLDLFNRSSKPLNGVQEAFNAVEESLNGVQESLTETLCPATRRDETRRDEKRGGVGKIQNGALAPRPSHWLMELWNQHRGKLSKATELSSPRRRACELRAKECPDRSQWEAAIKRMAGSRFCTGENDRGWRATFDWLLKPDTRVKVLEGKYDSKSSGAMSDERYRAEMKRIEMENQARKGPL